MGEYISDILYKQITSAGQVTITPEQLAIIAAQVPQQDLSGLVEKVSGKSLVNDTAITDLTDGGETALHTHAGGGITLSQVKSDTEIADAISKRHNNSNDHAFGSDNQDLSNLVVKVTGSDLLAITEAAKIHSNSLDHSGTFQDTEIAGKNPKRLFANLLAPVASSGTTEKVLLNLLIPAARAVVGSTFRTWIVGNSSSTGTLIFKVRCGPAGTITDTITWTAVTSVAQAANATAGFEVIATIRSATTIAVRGVGYAGTIQLPTIIAVPTTPAIIISSAWYINLTVICSSGTFTAQVGNIEEIK